MSEIHTPTNYHDFRKVFLDEAQARGLQLHSIQHRGLSPQGKPLFTDFAYTHFNPSLPTLLHISGCHGIEGYIGSTIQSEILRKIDLLKIQKLNLVFVHALNPWGMAWYRRVNAHNVDLNRNFHPDGPPSTNNFIFDVFAPLFERKPQQKKWRIWKSIFRSILRNGYYKTINAVSIGQYHLPESLFYGGSQIEPETSEVLRICKKLIKGTSPIYIIDVHSGLGKYKTENWLLDGHHSDEEILFWRQNLSEKLIDTRNTKGYYSAEGTLSLAFRKTFADRKVHYLFQEFGTLSRWSIFKALVSEHKSFLKLKLDRLRAFKMIEAFFPYYKDWRESCTAVGQASYMNLIQKLEENK